MSDFGEEKLAGSSRISVTKSNASATVADFASRPQTGKAADVEQSSSSFPEGGLAGWTTVAGAYVLHMTMRNIETNTCSGSSCRCVVSGACRQCWRDMS